VLEVLEKRELLATVSWIGGSGDWNTVSNWSDGTTNRLPDPGDDVVIDVAGAITVTHSSGSHTVQNLTVNEAFTLSGGTLSVSGTLDVKDGNTFSLAGGTISNARITIPSSASLIAAASTSTLSGVTLAGTLDRTVGAGDVYVSNGLTLDGGLIKIAGGRTLNFNGSQTFGGTGEVRFADGNVRNAVTVIGGTPTFGPNITIRGGVGGVAGSFINQATITADGSGSQIQVGGDWVNQGVIEATGGGAVTVFGAWTNTGTMREVDSTFTLDGTFRLSGLGSFSRSGGTVYLQGTLTNDGTLALDDTTGSWVFQSGKIVGGRISTAGSASLKVMSSSAYLDGTTLAGRLDVSGGSVFVTNGLTLDGGVINVADAGSVTFLGTQSLAGGGAMAFDVGLSNAIVASNGTLTIAAGITISGGSGAVRGSFVNQGRISSTSQITVGDTTWVNEGTVEAAGGTLSLGGSWTNSGTIGLTTGGTVQLGGTFRTSGIGTLDRRGGEIDLTGTLINDGTLVLDDTTGSWIVRNGTINGGRITTEGNAELIVGITVFCYLNGVTLAGRLAFTDVVGGQAIVTGDLTLDGGVIDLRQSNVLTFDGMHSLNGSGTVLLSGNQARVEPGSGTLTIGPGVTIRASEGQIGTFQGTLLNHGTIIVDGGGQVNAYRVGNFSGGTLTGGIWQVIGESILFLDSANITTNAADVLLDGPNAKLMSGILTSALAGLSHNAADGRLEIRHGRNLNVGAFDNDGSVIVGNGSTFTATGDFSTSGVATVDGSLVAPDVSVTASGTLTGSGTVAGDVTSDGAVNPGSSPGGLLISGDYAQTSTGATNIEVGGSTPGSQYDQLLVSGSANLAGTLNVTLIGGFGPSVGQTFTVLTFGSHVGAFDAINLPQVAGEPAFDVSVSATSLNLHTRVGAPNLAPDMMTIPATGSPSQLVSIPYTVHNLTGTPATGDWFDSFYMSRDAVLDASDPLLGRVTHAGGLDAFASYSGTLSARLPGVADGNYRVIAVVDSRGLVPDSDRANNTAVSTDSVRMIVPALTLGVPVPGTIADGQDLYFRVDTLAGNDFTISAEFAASPQAELNVRHGNVPDRSNFDQTAADVLSLRPQILFENPPGGAYYVLLHGREGAGTGQPFTVRVDAVPFAVRSISPARGSNQGTSTITLDSSRLTPSASVSLRSGGTVRTGTVTFVDPGRLFARFDLTGLLPGSYDVQLDDTGRSATQAGAFEVTAAAPGNVHTSVTSPAFLRPGRVGSVLIDYSNTGDTDLPAPLLELHAQNARLRLPGESEFLVDSIHLLGINRDGPAGILPPGYHGTITLEFLPITSADNDTFHFDVHVIDSQDAPINWEDFKDEMRPLGIPDDAWDVVFANFTSRAGETFGEYQSLLDQDATYLSQLGRSIGDVSRLLRFELLNADAVLPVATLGAALDLFDPASGLSLDFSRVFLQPISGRYRLGALGRGWTHTWDTSASSDALGDVTILAPAGVRSFVLRSDGTYSSPPGEAAVLTRPGGGYRLRETDGRVFAYRLDGLLDFVEEPNGTRVTAGYTGALLTRLSHSSGAALTLSYNAEGRLVRVTDSGGDSATYSYDGEHLTSVTTPYGTM
jgi:YD repeat-containing protein